MVGVRNRQPSRLRPGTEFRTYKADMMGITMKTVLRLKTSAISVLTTRGALDRWIRRIHTTKIISLICLSAFAAFAQDSNLAFVYQIGGTVPSPQMESLTSQSQANLTLQTSGQSWLLASLSSL